MRLPTSPPSSRTSPGHVLALLRTAGPSTRLELQERTGLSRVARDQAADPGGASG
ncbi:hypothetical protein [Nocardia abscessus]|uniref:hypothetical protein n=1 Tax=Nocardia abscessus TaxID=120957 RepID=UPI002458AFBE|nr:hypothetical protein [Nocardia abscessus]